MLFRLQLLRRKPTIKQYTLAEKEKFVSENQPCLKLLRQGLSEEYRSPPARSFYDNSSYYAKYRGIAKLLLLEAKMKELKGDWKGALNFRIDSIALGAKVAHGGPFIGGLVGLSIQIIGMRGSAKDIEHLVKTETAATIARLEKTFAGQTSYSDTLQEEKWCTIAASHKAFRALKTLKDWNDLYRSLGAISNGDAKQLSGYFKFMMTSKEQILNNFANFMDKSSELYKLPYSLPRASAPIPSDPWNQMLCPVVSAAQMKWLILSANQRELSTVLGLHLFKLEHGKYPNSLAELVPTDLKMLPDDPFALGGTLGYRLSGDKYTLYSIGPDAVDDGGKPIDDPTKANPKYPNLRARYQIHGDSKDDILAGKNAL